MYGILLQFDAAKMTFCLDTVDWYIRIDTVSRYKNASATINCFAWFFAGWLKKFAVSGLTTQTTYLTNFLRHSFWNATINAVFVTSEAVFAFHLTGMANSFARSISVISLVVGIIVTILCIIWLRILIMIGIGKISDKSINIFVKIYFAGFQRKILWYSSKPWHSQTAKKPKRTNPTMNVQHN